MEQDIVSNITLHSHLLYTSVPFATYPLSQDTVICGLLNPEAPSDVMMMELLPMTTLPVLLTPSPPPNSLDEELGCLDTPPLTPSIGRGEGVNDDRECRG